MIQQCKEENRVPELFEELYSMTGEKAYFEKVMETYDALYASSGNSFYLQRKATINKRINNS